MSRPKWITLACMQYLLVALYTSLNIIMALNVCQILFKQKRYRTLPLLFFYIFASFALSLRLVAIIGFYSTVPKHPAFFQILEIATLAKLFVGLVTSWMVIKIALRIRQRNGDKRIEKKIAVAELTILTFSSVGLVTFIVTVTVSANQPGNDGIAFRSHIDAYLKFLAFSFLALFCIMTASNLFLVC